MNPMAAITVSPTIRTASVRSTRVPYTRRRIEAAGWRTWLGYRENHVRDAEGTLVRIDAVWVAEAERSDGSALVSEASSPVAAWAGLASAVRARRHAPSTSFELDRRAS